MYSKKGRPQFVLCIVAIPLFLSACGSDPGGDPIGGPCVYNETIGSAVIISVNDADPSENNCNISPVQVVFDFEPSGPVQGNDATDKNRRLTVGDGKNPSREYAIAKGLIVGTAHNCTRKVIISGTCSPEVFEFLDIDFSDYGAFCF